MAAGALPRPAAELFATARRRLLADRGAALVIRVGGLAVIASILAILAFLLVEIAPVLRPARVTMGAALALPGAPPGAALLDEHRSHAAVLGMDGVVRVVRLADGALALERPLGGALTAAAADPLHGALAGAGPDGAVVVAPVAFAVTFADGVRRVAPSVGESQRIELAEPGAAIAALAVRGGDATTVAAALADGRIAVVQRQLERNPFSGEVTERRERRLLEAPAPVAALELGADGLDLYGGTRDGRVLRWDLRAGAAQPAEEASAGSAGVTALALLIGGRSLVVGQQDGSLSVWFAVPKQDGRARLARIRDFPRYPAAIEHIAASGRDRSFLISTAGGSLGLHHSTSGRTLWRGELPAGEATSLAVAPRGDGALLASAGRSTPLEIDSPHPELSLAALFGKVWYEGAPAPAWVWQSSSGDDAFEPKLSLVPLVAGTLKGTCYALLLAIPLGVLGAMYTSQFMHPRLQRWVKPGVEIMAALPSVVLGFLAALWLAPRLEHVFPALMAMAFAVPAAAIAAGTIWSRIPRRVTARVPAGAEVAAVAPAIVAAGAGCIALSARLEDVAFGGSFPAWLDRTAGFPYDQRNAIVVGIAMGFAVIPIIFAIAEDAFSNVPSDLAAGSLALGANRWQTVARVVLPTASPGIFSAVMVGFGRAVGETMIVLMATGNTPIMDWSPFNGFRTLSANIAVEIPEAPQGGTLYRTLFLAALLLFAMTFAVNTAAELVRHRLRRRYARL